MAKTLPPVRSIALDPGFEHTGWGVVDWLPAQQRLCHVAHGKISTDSAETTEQRVFQFSRELSTVLRDQAPSGHLVLCAEAYLNYGKVFWSGVQTLYMIGAFIAQVAQHGYSVNLIPARVAKQTIGLQTIKGEKPAALKRRCGARVGELLEITPPKTSHEADALCVAIAGLKAEAEGLTVVKHGASLFDGLDAALARGL